MYVESARLWYNAIMPETQILNIQKSDSFEEIFDEFSRSTAEEVIFIFPKNSGINQRGYFEAFKAEAERNKKKISVMTSDPLVAQLAGEFSMDILSNPEPRTRRSSETQETQEIQQPEVIADTVLARRKPLARNYLDSANVTPSGRRIRDIIPQAEDNNVEVKEFREKDIEVAISRTPLSPEHIKSEQVSEIDRLWHEKTTDSSISHHAMPRRGRRWVILGGVGLSVMIVLASFVALSKAKISLFPTTEDLNFKLAITSSPDVSQVSFEFKKIPGQFFSVKKEETGSYELATKKEVTQKAEGKITIFNTGGSSQRLVATTRFETKAGLIFRIPETITVPAGGSIGSMVYADRPGVDYNIPASDFTIPGFTGTPKFNEFSAKSDTPMTGGFIGSSSVVTESDFDGARNELTTKITASLAEALQEQAGGLKIIEPFSTKFGDPVTNAKVDQATEKFSMTLSAEADVIAFREEDVKEIIKNHVSQNNKLDVVWEDLQTEYVITSFDAQKKMLVFEVRVHGRAATRLDLPAIEQEIKGMNQSEVRSYFEAMRTKGLRSARILLSPFWARSIPNNPDRIDLLIDTSI